MATIYGDDWPNLIDGTSGRDVIFGFGSDDDIYGLGGDDDIDGGWGSDYLLGGSGDDYIVGRDGFDYLSGAAGNDSLYGGSGYDDLYGGAGRDHLSGGSSDDLLVGGGGRDRLHGGAGVDMLVFGRGASGITSTNADRIGDWNPALDWLDMTIRGTSGNYRESRTSATSIEAAAAQAENGFTSASIAHVFLYNSQTDTGYLLSDLNNDNRFETGVIMSHSGRASDMSYLYIL